ncbi:MAG: dodecin [Parasphingopyxis sp.]|nr:dodecin family protein [Sphingomonadales bacterium]
MSDNVYKITEVVGTSETSIEDAIRGAVERTAQTVRDIGWFEVIDTRGHVADGKVVHFQVTVKIGFHIHD